MSMPYCRCCGVPIPEGQPICSMCYGDPYYGRDGYYLGYLNYLYEKSMEEMKYYDELMDELYAWEAANEEDIGDLED